MVVSSVLCALPLPVVSGVVCATCGAVYGALRGALAFTLAATLGSGYALVLSRSLLRAHVARLAARWRTQARALDAAVAAEPFTLVFLLRLSPIVPFGVASALLALTPVKAEAFILATALGTVLASIPFTYAGSLGSGGEPLGIVHVVASVVGLAATVQGGRVLNRLLAQPAQDGDAEAPASRRSSGDLSPRDG